MSLDSDTTSKERERAFSRFEAIFNVHNAAIEAFRILEAHPEAPDLIAAAAQLRLGMRPGITAMQLDDHAERDFGGDQGRKGARLRGDPKLRTGRRMRRL